MQKFGNFEVNSVTVDEGFHLLELAGDETDEGKKKFRDALLKSAVTYVHPDSQARIECFKAPFKEFMAVINDLFVAALVENGFREASE